MFIKREWKNLDKVMLIVSFLIVCISLCIIGSATHINKGAINYDFVAKQGAAFVVDLMIILFFSRFDYAKLKKYAKPLYIINLLMLVAVMFVGTSALGAQRWIQLGPITLQPSEFSKLIISSARHRSSATAWASSIHGVRSCLSASTSGFLSSWS